MKTVTSKWTVAETPTHNAKERNNSPSQGDGPMRGLNFQAAALAALTAMLAVALPASAANAGNVNGNKLQCFSGTTDGGFFGECSLTADGVATLNNNSPTDTPPGNDTTGTTDPFDQYSGVYIQNSNLDGKALKEVNQLRFSFTGVATAGSPRLTIPIDTNGDGVTEFYVSIGAFYCDDGSGNVDAINGTTCTIYRNDNGSGPWANWAAFVAANPSWRVANALPFIIADDPGFWTVSNVQLGKGPAKRK